MHHLERLLPTVHEAFSGNEDSKLRKSADFDLCERFDNILDLHECGSALENCGGLISLMELVSVTTVAFCSCYRLILARRGLSQGGRRDLGKET